MIGPTNSLYSGGNFKLNVTFPPAYPSQPPHFVFRSMLHLNVYASGEICLLIFYHDYNSNIKMDALIEHIRCMLSDPNPDSPANSQLKATFTTNMAAYQNQIRTFTAQST